MAIPTDYASLQAWLLDWSNRPDFSSKAPEFIALAEQEMNRRIKIKHNEAATTVTLTAGTEDVSLPSGYLQLIDLNVVDNIIEQPQKRSTEYLDQLRSNTSMAAARPRWYAIVGDNALAFDSPADQNYTLNIRYYKRWDVATDDTNWLLANHCAVYLGLCLKWAGMYIKEPNGAAVWMAEADKQIDLIIMEDRRDRSKGMTARVDTALVGKSSWNVITDAFGGRVQ